MTKVLIVTGGTSPERSISLISSNQVRLALEKLGYGVWMFDLKEGYSNLKTNLKKAEVVFPVLHGKDGEDGTLYKFLKGLNIPFVGSNPVGAKIAFNKINHKQFCDENQIPTARWEILGSEPTQQIIKFGFPCVLKAAQGGSSREVVILKDQRDLEKKLVQKILSLDDRLYVEEYLDGIEVTAGILEDKALPVLEIVPPQSGWFDYKNKYSGETKEIPNPSSVLKKVQEKIQELALKIHQDLDLGQYSRSDFIVVGNQPIILETNTPGGVGMTPESLYPKAAKAVGISFENLMQQFVEMSLRKN